MTWGITNKTLLLVKFVPMQGVGRNNHFNKVDTMQLGMAVAVYGAIVLVMSVVCFITYWFDKRQAGLGGRRVSERQLLTMGFLGGWPGALLAQRRFRHKTQKVSFRVQFWLLVVAHLCLVTWMGYILLKG